MSEAASITLVLLFMPSAFLVEWKINTAKSHEMERGPMQDQYERFEGVGPASGAPLVERVANLVSSLVVTISKIEVGDLRSAGHPRHFDWTGI